MHWYYEKDGSQYGPVDNSGMSELLSKGQINRDTLVWKEGMNDWTPVSKTEFHAISESLPPPLPHKRTPSWPVNGLIASCLLTILEKIVDLFLLEHQLNTIFADSSVTSTQLIAFNIIALACALAALVVSIYMKTKQMSKGGFVLTSIFGFVTVMPGGAIAGILVIVMSVIGYRKTKGA